MDPRTFDVQQDQHPCDLVTKYLCTNSSDAEFEALGNALEHWMTSHNVEIPDVTQ